MADNNPTPPVSPLIGDVVNPLTLQNSDYKLPEAPHADIYGGPSTDISKQDVKTIQTTQPKTVFGDRVKDLIKKTDDAPKWAGDLTPYGKIVAYDADYTGANFQRYYNHSKFNQLGFSPFRDNETLYNQKGTWADDAGRMLRGWSSLFATGAYDGIKSWSDNPFDPEADTETAEDMNRKMSTMTSSRGGFGGGVINFGANTAYSMGLVSEFMAETAALAALTAVTLGTDAPVTGTIEAARAASLATKLGQASKMMSNTYKVLTSLKDLNTAKNFWKSANAGEALGKTLNFLNPLENTVQYLKDTQKALKTGEQVYDLAKVSKGFGSFIKDVRQAQMVMSEANLEGGTVQNEMIKQLTDEFYTKNGRMPGQEEAHNIYKTAGIAGNKTIAWNMPALFLSNKIVFENAFKGFKPMNMLAAEASEGLAGKLVFNKAWKSAGVNPWTVVKEGWQANIKSLTKASTWMPKNLAKNVLMKGVSYTSKNLTEALQEQYQEAVSASMNEYYKSIYQDPSKAGSDEMGSIFSNNLSKQFTTTQGWETFASGFFMGGVLQGPQKIVFDKVPKKIFQMRNPAEYAERTRAKQEWTDKVVESLNEVTKDPAKFFNSVSENMVVQRKAGNTMREANENNDEKSFRDVADESTFNHLHTVINSGKFDLIMEHLKDMKELSPSELEEAFGPVPEGTDKNTYYNNRIESLMNNAESIKERTDVVDKHFVNPFNPYKYNKEKNNDQYISEYMRWKAFEDAKKAAVFSQHSFDRTLNRMQNITNDVVEDLPVSKASTSDFTLLFDDKLLDSEINSLNIEVKAFAEGTGQQKTQARQSQKKKEALESLRDDIDNYRTTLKGEQGVKAVDNALNTLHKSYKDYLKVIANINNDHVFNDKVDSSFAKIRDYFMLEADSNNLASTVNFLHNPSSFIEYSKRMEQVRQSLYDQRTEHMKAALDEYMKIKDQNELLNKLLEDGVYIHPDDIKPLIENKIIPEQLFDVVNYEELDPNSDKYKKGFESINQWLEATKEPEVIVEESQEVLEEIPTPVVDNTIVKITNVTPIAEMPVELVDELVESFRAENRTRKANDEPMLGIKDPAVDKSVILSNPAFTNYVKVFSKPRTIITNFNTKSGRTLEPVKVEVVKPKEEVASVSIIITTDMRQQLSDLGYSKEDIDKMRPAQANHFIRGNITKKVEIVPEVKDNTETEKALKNIENMFSEANTLEEIEGVEEEVLALLTDSELRRKINLTNEFLTNLAETRKRELATSFTYESINPGDVVMMNDNVKMLVAEKTDTELKLRKFGDMTENFTIVKKEVVPSTIKYKYSEGMENVNITTPVTPEEKEISNQSVKNYTEFNEDDDSDAVEEDMKKATSMTKQDRDDDLTNNLGCKK